jgi:mannitol/fructose-specific phosphotransferase system IIA component
MWACEAIRPAHRFQISGASVVIGEDALNKWAALKLMRKLLKKYGFVPDKFVTDELRSYAAAASHLGIAKRSDMLSGSTSDSR